VSEFIIKSLHAHYYIDGAWWVTPDYATVAMDGRSAILRKATAIPSLKDSIAWIHLYAQELYATHLMTVTDGLLNSDPETDPLWNIYRIRCSIYCDAVGETTKWLRLHPSHDYFTYISHAEYMHEVFDNNIWQSE
jgi:hypothetical protein